MAPAQELKLRLQRGDLVQSTVDALGAFSEVGGGLSGPYSLWLHLENYGCT